MRKALFGAFAIALVSGLYMAAGKITNRPFPEGTTPEGAYLRIVLAITEDRPEEMFAYLETEAQWAAFTIQETRAKACRLIAAQFPDGSSNEAYSQLREDCEAKDGPNEFALLARRKAWVGRLRKDLSGVDRVEVLGKRATVVTARGTRYPFRIRDNGLWGLTVFTAELLAESDRATRDLKMVQASADDYARARAPSPALTITSPSP